NLSDQLALASARVDDEDLILRTLNGLSDEYNSFKTNIRTRSGAMAMEEFTSLLTSEAIYVESDVRKINSSSNEVSLAFNTSRTNENLSNNSNNSFRSYNFSNNRGKQNFRGNNRGRNNRGRTSHNRGYQSSSQNMNYSSPVCQICGNSNHYAAECFHINNFSYQTPSHFLSVRPNNNSRALLTTSAKPENSN
ncbi:hypothetical protein U1Q18_009664, partial [Sarracenia purpurea var. burkii]